ncbi:MAG: DUF5615 family PIN-like protein [Nitrospiraceae bacterium]
MKILLDESAPRLIKTRLPDFSIRTVQEMGWSGLKNGPLLKLAEEPFDVLVTSDKKLSSQQNLSGRRLAVVVLPSNQVPVITSLLPVLEQSLKQIQPGTVIEIPLSSGADKK